VAMERVLRSESMKSDLIARGRLQCSKFSWDRCAEETLQIYRGLL
jgi:glycosyltransferase involved in cell wall biosynthesis